ncbi:hypothetical protein BK127_30855 [Paenibacillus sp. FSL H7-0331]|nr:hypothetical protein BK127_30855 [Paenibacillus sp. FSL H7-0331]
MNEMDLAFWQEIIEVKQIEEAENDMTRKLEFEHDWQWDQLSTALDGLYHKGLFGDYNWAEKASKREITAADALFLSTVILARQNGVDV